MFDLSVSLCSSFRCRSRLAPVNLVCLLSSAGKCTMVDCCCRRLQEISRAFAIAMKISMRYDDYEISAPFWCKWISFFLFYVALRMYSDYVTGIFGNKLRFTTREKKPNQCMLFVCRKRWDCAIQCRMHFLKCGTVNAISIVHYQVAPRNHSRTFRKWWRFLFANDNEHLKCKSLKIAQTTDKRHFYDLLLDAFEQWIGGARFLYCVRRFFPSTFDDFVFNVRSIKRFSDAHCERRNRAIKTVRWMLRIYGGIQQWNEL